MMSDERKIYEQVGKKLKGNVAIKISTGEPGGHNFLSPNLIKDLVVKKSQLKLKT